MDPFIIVGKTTDGKEMYVVKTPYEYMWSGKFDRAFHFATAEAAENIWQLYNKGIMETDKKVTFEEVSVKRIILKKTKELDI